jgi:periplasmic protein TonB
MPRISTLFSIAVHVIAIGGALLSSVIAPGLLPSPRSALAFHDLELVKIADVPAPRVTRPAAASSEHTVSSDVAPLTAPDRIMPETGRENLHEAGSTRSDVPSQVGVDCHCVIPGDVAPPPPPPPPPVKPMRLHSGMQAPQKIVDVKPIYPVFAQTVRREGLVILEAVIDGKGSAESVRVLKGVPMLDQAAVDAVRQWRFTPALLNGEPVPVVMTVTISFQLK